MSVMLVLMAFILILIGVFVQTTHHDREVKFAVSWMTGIGACAMLLFAGKVYFS